MSYKEIAEKIDEVISGLDIRIQKVNKKMELYSHQIKNRKKDINLQKYQYELERDNYGILKCKDELKKIELFKKRCMAYKEYLYNIEKNDLLNIKKQEYNFIKLLQEETILYFESKEDELKQRAVLERICGKELKSLIEIKLLEEKRDAKYEMFLKDEFYLDEDKLYTLEYLNYDINEVTTIIYEQDLKKRAN